MKRRFFLKSGLLGTAAAFGYLPGCSSDSGGDGIDEPIDLPGPDDDLGEIPTAILGNTGEEVTILGLGTTQLGQRNGGNPTGAAYDEMVAVFSEAIDRGITYIDTAHYYGRAQQAIGEAIRGRRDKVFIATKLLGPDRTTVAQQMEECLADLGTDYVDVLHMHSAGSADIDYARGPDGAWTYINEQKASGRARYVGITGHNNPTKFLTMLGTDQVDVMMVAMNFVDYNGYNFEDVVLPVAQSRGVGVMAMKVFGGTEALGRDGFAHIREADLFPSQMESTFGVAALSDAVRYAKSLEGVTGQVIGVSNAAELRHNIKMAVETKPFDADELAAVRQLGQDVIADWQGRFG